MSKAEWVLVEHGGADWRTERLPVPGGWLYRHIMRIGAGKDQENLMSCAFVPDP